MNTEKAETTVRGENMVLKVGSVVGFLTVFGWAIWWASGVQSDLNTIKGTLSGLSKYEAILTRMTMIEQYGSPKVAELEKRLNEFQKELEMHKATGK